MEWVGMHPEYGFVLSKRSALKATVAMLKQNWPPLIMAEQAAAPAVETERTVTSGFIMQCIFDGTISTTKLEAAAVLQVKAFGKNRFPAFSENNRTTWDDIIKPECARILGAI